MRESSGKCFRRYWQFSGKIIEGDGRKICYNVEEGIATVQILCNEFLWGDFEILWNSFKR
jgi:hypothetical protein